MRRTLVGFADQDLSLLDEISASQHVSRAELIRQAVSNYLEQFKSADAAQAGKAADDAFGLWRAKKVDGMAFQNKLRQEW
jgi:Ribbon-helix-helix protein, copG family